MDYAFGVDLSRNQGKVDFDVLAAHTNPLVSFIALRAGISWGYTDAWFPRNWSEAKRVYLPRTAYHALYPGESVVRQMDHFFRILGNDLGDFRLVEDWELVHGQNRGTITKAILGCDRYIEDRTRRHMILYSRANLLDQYTYFSELAHLDLWLAEYSGDPYPAKEHACPPTLPKGAKGWRFHQTGDHTSGAGFGVESLQLDYDRFNGTLADFQAWAGLASPPEPSDAVKLERLWKAHRELHRDV